MNVSFNLYDYNLFKIQKESNLESLLAKKHYRIYGLVHNKENNGFCVLVSVNKIYHNQKLQSIKSFFLKRGIPIYFEDSKSKEKIYIGLRRDLRKQVSLSAGIVQTLIYFFENRLKLNEKMPIYGIPKFKDIE